MGRREAPAPELVVNREWADGGGHTAVAVADEVDVTDNVAVNAHVAAPDNVNAHAR